MSDHKQEILNVFKSRGATIIHPSIAMHDDKLIVLSTNGLVMRQWGFESVHAGEVWSRHLPGVASLCTEFFDHVQKLELFEALKALVGGWSMITTEKKEEELTPEEVFAKTTTQDPLTDVKFCEALVEELCNLDKRNKEIDVDLRSVKELQSRLEQELQAIDKRKKALEEEKEEVVRKLTIGFNSRQAILRTLGIKDV